MNILPVVNIWPCQLGARFPRVSTTTVQPTQVSKFPLFKLNFKRKMSSFFGSHFCGELWVASIYLVLSAVGWVQVELVLVGKLLVERPHNIQAPTKYFERIFYISWLSALLGISSNILSAENVWPCWLEHLESKSKPSCFQLASWLLRGSLHKSSNQIFLNIVSRVIG